LLIADWKPGATLTVFGANAEFGTMPSCSQRRHSDSNGSGGTGAGRSAADRCAPAFGAAASGNTGFDNAASGGFRGVPLEPRQNSRTMS
jgi:hypothetical protein